MQENLLVLGNYILKVLGMKAGCHLWSICYSQMLVREGGRKEGMERDKSKGKGKGKKGESEGMRTRRY